jgi:hypothetical protein
MRLIEWSDADRETLRAMRAQGDSYRAISDVLKRPQSCLIQACKRFDIHAPQVLATDEMVVEICKTKEGMKVQEISHKVNKSPSRMIAVVRNLTNAGRLFKGGSRKYPRYFFDEEDAKAYDRKRKEETRNKAREVQREKRAKAQKPAPAKKLTDKKPVQIHITSKAKQPAAPVNAKIVWPEHVAVQVIPTPPPRFSFTPPAGWRGQITHDWMNRRLGAA